jgi:integrase
MANIPKSRTLTTGRVVYEAYVKAEGRTHYLRRWQTYEAAATAIADFEAKLRERKRARVAGGTPPPLEGRLLSEAVKAWLATLEVAGTDAHRSHKKYSDQMRLHVLNWPAFENVRIDSVTSEMVRTWHTALLEKDGKQVGPRFGKKLSPQTANTIRLCLSSFFTWCVEKDWLLVNPVGAAKKLKAKRRRFQWINSAEDVSRLLAACDDIEVREFVALLVSTGLRRGELLSLHWSDVNLKNRVLEIHAGGRGATPHETKPTKTEEERTVPLLDMALAVLKARHLRTKGRGFVFASPATGGIRNPSTFCDGFKVALAASGIHRAGMPQIRVHDLRHTFACHWVTSGGDIFRLSKVLGHATVKTTEKFYARFSTENDAQHYHRCSFAMPDETRDNVITLHPAPQLASV